MRLTLFCAAGILLAGASLVQADVYRWKDADGRIHYSDRPVEGAERLSTYVRHPPSASTSPSAARSEAQRSQMAAASENEPPADAKAVKEVQEDLAKKRAEECPAARARYEKAISSRRIYKEGKNGEREFLTDPQADEYRAKARAEMDALCNPPAR
jgi:hypothetical protein